MTKVLPRAMAITNLLQLWVSSTMHLGFDIVERRKLTIAKWPQATQATRMTLALYIYVLLSHTMMPVLVLVQCICYILTTLLHVFPLDLHLII